MRRELALAMLASPLALASPQVDWNASTCQPIAHLDAEGVIEAGELRVQVEQTRDRSDKTPFTGDRFELTVSNGALSDSVQVEFAHQQFDLFVVELDDAPPAEIVIVHANCRGTGCGTSPLVILAWGGEGLVRVFETELAGRVWGRPETSLDSPWAYWEAVCTIEAATADAPLRLTLDRSFPSISPPVRVADAADVRAASIRREVYERLVDPTSHTWTWRLVEVELFDD